jgi:hypothetical protein
MIIGSAVGNIFFRDMKSDLIVDKNKLIVVYDQKRDIVKQILEYREQLAIFEGKKKVCL